MFKKRTDKSSEKSMDTTTNTTTTPTTNTMKSKKFPTMFKKMMLSRLKNMSKDATSAVKSSVQKKTSSKKKSAAAAAATVAVETAATTVKKADSLCKPRRPSTATLDKPLLVNCKRVAEAGTPEARPAPTNAAATVAKRPVVQQQQFNNRTYRVKTKDRKSVLSLPEVSKQAARARKSCLPVKVKVKSPAPAPPVHRKNDTTPLSLEPLQPSRTVRENEKEGAKSEMREEYQPEKWVPTAVGSARKKRLVLCYLCGKEFGTASIPFHEPQCLKKWTLENSKLPEHLQRNTPQKPMDSQNMSVDDWNQLAWEATQSNLVPCDYCQRKFLANRLEAHARVCIESKKKLPVPKLAAKSTVDKPKKKPMPCYVCGRLFGTASIGIHEPQCLAKWSRENDGLAPHLRRPEPVKPAVIVDEETGKVNHQATRDEHWKTYLSQLVPCDRCKRTFDPDRLEIHQRSCKGLTTNVKNS